MSSRGPNDFSAAQKAIGLGAIAIIGILILTAAFAFVTVDTGNVAVEKDRGAVTGNVMGPGWHFINPVSESTVSIDTRPQTQTMAGDNEISVITGDGQDVWVDMTVRYRVERQNADQFHTEYRNHDQARERVITPTVRSNARAEASDLAADEIITRDGRIRLEDSVEQSLNENVEGSGITIEAVQVRGIRLNDDYGTALENVEIENTKAQQRIIESESQAEANQIRQESLSDEVLMEQYIESIDKSDTVVLATGDNGQPVIMDMEGVGSEGNTTTAPNGASAIPEGASNSSGGEASA